MKIRLSHESHSTHVSTVVERAFVNLYEVVIAAGIKQKEVALIDYEHTVY